jgi:hypothetical protein
VVIDTLLRRCASLTRLSLSNTELPATGCALQRLLDRQRNGLEDVRFKCVDGLPADLNLRRGSHAKSLSLRECALSAVSVQRFVPPVNHRLVRLDLSSNPLTSASWSSNTSSLAQGMTSECIADLVAAVVASATIKHPVVESVRRRRRHRAPRPRLHDGPVGQPPRV